MDSCRHIWILVPGPGHICVECEVCQSSVVVVVARVAGKLRFSTYYAVGRAPVTEEDCLSVARWVLKMRRQQAATGRSSSTSRRRRSPDRAA